MDKNTILAIVLSALVITVGMFLTQVLNSKYAANVPPQMQTEAEPNAPVPIESQEYSEPNTAAVNQSIPEQSPEQSTQLPMQNFPAKKIIETTDLLNVIFNTVGGVVCRY